MIFCVIHLSISVNCCVFKDSSGVASHDDVSSHSVVQVVCYLLSHSSLCQWVYSLQHILPVETLITDMSDSTDTCHSYTVLISVLIFSGLCGLVQTSVIDVSVLFCCSCYFGAV